MHLGRLALLAWIALAPVGGTRTVAGSAPAQAAMEDAARDAVARTAWSLADRVASLAYQFLIDHPDCPHPTLHDVLDGVSARVPDTNPDAVDVDIVNLAMAAMYDPWGAPYRLTFTPRDVLVVVSDGPDGRPWTDDDVGCSTEGWQ